MDVFGPGSSQCRLSQAALRPPIDLAQPSRRTGYRDIVGYGQICDER
jgi:hypothetical protein